ncbi:hypothetical protein HG530_008487 [Fusarium avenaceum]|nr:hypothetical protein HG530_008487 [Fusarium avenaceum]
MAQTENYVSITVVNNGTPSPEGDMPQLEKQSPPDQAPAPAPTPNKKGARFWLLFVAIALTTFLAALDTSIISTALPAIAADLGSDSTLTLIAVCIFTLGSGLCGGAHNTAMMVGGRAVQGLGGGGILTMSEIVVCDMVSIRERGMYAGIIGGVWAIAAVVAPVMGGAFAQNISWRWIFYINLPIAGVSLIALGLFLKLARPPSGTLKHQMARIDWGGSILLIGSVTSLVLALSWGGSEHPWSAWQTIVPLIIGLIALIAFFVYQGSPWLKEPTMPLRLFGNRTSSTFLIISFIHSLLLYWICYFLPVYFQAVKEASPTRSAVMLFTPQHELCPFSPLN